MVVLIKKKSSNNQQGMSSVVFNQNLKRTKRMSLDKIFSVHMLLELSTFLILQAFVIFCGPVKEMVALIILTKWKKQNSVIQRFQTYLGLA